MGRSREWKRSSQTSDIGDVLRLLHCACYIYQHPMRISRRRTVTILVHHFLGTSHITGPSDALSILLYLNHRPASGRTPPAWLARLAHHPHPPMSGHLYAGSVPSLYILMPVSASHRTSSITYPSFIKEPSVHLRHAGFSRNGILEFDRHDTIGLSLE
jgi:hypothetical protein